MPLPHYPGGMQVTPTNPIYKNRFDCHIVTENDSVFESSVIEKINYKTKNNIDIIKLTIQLDDNNFKSFNPKDSLKEIIYLQVCVIDQKGNIISKYFHSVSLIEQSLKFNLNSSNLCKIQVKFTNNKTILDNDLTTVSSRRLIESLKRELKLNKLLDK
jgi:hypothetical protein